MRKIYFYPIFIIFIFLLIGCSEYEKLEKPSLLLQYYEGPYNWAGIVLGQSSREETIVQLKSLDFVDSETITQEDAYTGFDFRIFLDLQPGYREEVLSIWFKDDKAMVLDFYSPYFTLAEIQENLGEVEKFVVYGWMHERPMMDYFGYSVSAGYVIRGGPSDGRNLDELEIVTLSDNSIFFLDLIHPDVLMNVLSIEMGTAARDYLINEGHFVDWHGYGEYEVVRPDYDLYMP